jgi:hypothetical protein
VTERDFLKTAGALAPILTELDGVRSVAESDGQ